MNVGNCSRSLGSLVNCSAIVTITWKPNFHFASDRNDHDGWDRIRVYLCDLSDRQRLQKVHGNHQRSDCSDRNDPSDPMEIIAQ